MKLPHPVETLRILSNYQKRSMIFLGLTWSLWVTVNASAGSLFFDIGDAVVIPNSESLNLSGPVTVEAWVYPSAEVDLQTFKFIVSKNLDGTGYTLLGVGDGYRFSANRVDGESAESPGPLFVGEWIHLAGVWDGTQTLIYINGNLIESVSNVFEPIPNDVDLRIGGSIFGEITSWRGWIDDVRVWNVARSQQEIAQNMLVVLEGEQPGLVGYWQFEENVGDVAFDASGFVNNGTLSGTSTQPEWSDFSAPVIGSCDGNPNIIGLCETVSTGIPSITGDGLLVNVYNGIGGGPIPPNPGDIFDLDATGQLISPVIDFPSPGATVTVGKDLTRFFADTTIPPDEIAEIPAANFILEIEGLISITNDLDLDVTTPEIDLDVIVSSDDGMHLILGATLIDEVGDQAFTPRTSRVIFEGPGIYPIKLLFAANTIGQSGLELSWNTATSGTEIIPQRVLYLSEPVCEQKIEFEEFDSGTILGDQFSDLGVEFNNIGGDLQITDAFPDEFVPVSGDRVYADPADTPDDAGALEFTFRDPVNGEIAATNFFSFFVIDAESTGSSVTAFDTDDTVIFSEQVNAGGGSQELVTIAAPNIARVLVTLGSGEDTSALDNVCFNTPISIASPDFQISSLSVPLEGISGQSFQVSWAVTNEGFAQAEGPWTDAVYLSTDNQFDESDTQLFAVTSPSLLDVGESYERIQQGTLPSSPGDYWIIVKTDVANVIEEIGGENNNIRITKMPTTTVQQPLPDIIVESITPISSGILSGSTIEVEYVVRNTGTGPTIPVWKDLVFLSVDEELIEPPFFLFNDQIIGQGNNPRILLPGEAEQNTLQVILPNDVTGTHYIAVYADSRPEGVSGAGFSMTELNEGNNILFSNPFEIELEPQPDLVVLDIDVPSKAFSGSLIEINWTLENQGLGVSESGELFHSIYLSLNDEATLSEEDILFGESGSVDFLSMAPGENRDFSASDNIDPELSGEYFVKVVTDTGNTVSEFGAEGNNIGVSESTIAIFLSEAPDIIPMSIEVSNGVQQPGQLLTVDWSADNSQGAPPPFQLNWKDAIYLSSDSQLDTNDVRLADFGQGSSENTDSNFVISPYQKSRNVRIPNETAPGNYFLIVNIDDLNEVYEGISGGEDNNSRATAVPIAIGNQFADLLISITSQPPAIGTAGSDVQLSWEVSNVGSVDTPVDSWFDRIYFSADETLDESDQLLVSQPRNGFLGAGDSYARQAELTIPNVAAGVFNILVVADSQDAVFEGATGNANNIVVIPFSVNGEGADLVVTNIQAPSLISSGEDMEVSWTVENMGLISTTTSVWQDFVWLSQNDILGDSDDVLLGGRTHSGSLSSNESYSMQSTFTLPIELSGSYRVFLSADFEDDVFETDESNNSGQSDSPTVITLVDAANLVVDEVVVAEPVFSGQPMSVSWVVSNIGDGPTNTNSWTDSVYLSLDQFFDPNDQFLGQATRTGAVLFNGDSYSVTNEFPIPLSISGPYFVLVVSDSSDEVYEGDQALDNIGVTQSVIDIALPTPSDLVVEMVESINSTVIMGEETLVQWTIRNNGDAAINGQWQDSVYISSDPVWDIDDVRVGSFPVSTSGPQLPATSLQASATIEIPGVLPGDYYLLVRSDVFNNIPETDESNNCCATLANPISIGVTPLVLSEPKLPEPYIGTLSQGQSRFFELETPPNETVRISLDHSSPTAWTEMYVKFGSIPTSSDFDFQFNNPGLPDQDITIPSSEHGTYYILAVATNGTFEPGGIGVEIVAENRPFEISSISPAEVGPGSVTLLLTGSKFTPTTVVELFDEVDTISPTFVGIVDSTNLLATFNLEDFSGQRLSIRASNNDLEQSQVIDALSVSDATSTGLSLNPDFSVSLRAGVAGSATVVVTNDGNIDVDIAKLRVMIRDDGGVEVSSIVMGVEQVWNILELEGSNWFAEDILLPLLRPGESRFIPISALAPTPRELYVYLEVADFDEEEVIAEILPSIESFRLYLLDSVNLTLEERIFVSNQSKFYEYAVPIYLEVLRNPSSLQNKSGLPGPLQAKRSDDHPIVQLGVAFLACGGGLCVAPTVLACAPAGPLGFTACLGAVGWNVARVCVSVCTTLLCRTSNLNCPGADDGPICSGAIGDTAVGGLVCWLVFGSSDPNEKWRSEGIGTEGWISGINEVSYRVYFENLSDATAPAARVVIRDSIDDDLNPASMRLGSIVIAGQTIDIPENRINYSTTVDLIDSRGVLLNVNAGVNAQVDPPEAFWVLQSIDPETGEPPTDGDTGFLVPEDGTGLGQGFVEFTIVPKSTVETGAVIRNSADIIFDSNEIITTNEVFNTIDVDLPFSQLSPIDPITAENLIDIVITGDDQEGGSGLAGFNILVSSDFGQFVPVGFTSDQIFEFSAESGRVYRFLSQAVDNAGNIELEDANSAVLVATLDVSLEELSDTGLIGDLITNDTTPTLVAVSAPMTDVSLLITGDSTSISANILTGPNGRGVYNISNSEALQDGVYQVTVASSGISTTRSITIDTAPPGIQTWSSAAMHGQLGDAFVEIIDDGSSVENRSASINSIRLSYPQSETDLEALLPESVLVEGIDSSGVPLDLSAVTTTVSVQESDGVQKIMFQPMLPDAAVYCITLNGVTDAAGNQLVGDGAIRKITALRGDATSDRRVNNTDVGGILSLVGTDPIDLNNSLHIRSDLDTDGDIDDDDVQIALSARGTDLRFVDLPCVLNTASNGKLPNDDPSNVTFQGSATGINRQVTGGGLPGDRNNDAPRQTPLLQHVDNIVSINSIENRKIDPSRIGLHDPTGQIDVAKLVTSMGLHYENIEWLPVSGWSILSLKSSESSEGLQRSLIGQFADHGLFAGPILLDEANNPMLVTSNVIVAFAQEVDKSLERKLLTVGDAGSMIVNRDLAGVQGMHLVSTSFRNGFDVLTLIDALSNFSEIRFVEADTIFQGVLTQAHLPPKEAGRSLVTVVMGHSDYSSSTHRNFATGGSMLLNDDGWRVCLQSNSATEFVHANTFVGGDDSKWFSKISWNLDALSWAIGNGANKSINTHAYAYDSKSLKSAYRKTSELGIRHFAATDDQIEGIDYRMKFPSSQEEVMRASKCDQNHSVIDTGSGLVPRPNLGELVQVSGSEGTTTGHIVSPQRNTPTAVEGVPKSCPIPANFPFKLPGDVSTTTQTIRVLAPITGDVSELKTTGVSNHED